MTEQPLRRVILVDDHELVRSGVRSALGDSVEIVAEAADVDSAISAIVEHRPDVVGVEDLYSHYKHPKTAVLMGHARGVVLCAARGSGAQVASYAATRVKRSLTGNGHASKTQMQSAILVQLGLNQFPEPPDVADALAIALCTVQEQRSKEPANR